MYAQTGRVNTFSTWGIEVPNMNVTSDYFLNDVRITDRLNGQFGSVLLNSTHIVGMTNVSTPLVITDLINELTGASGVTIDSVLLKDGGITGIDDISISKATAPAFITTDTTNNLASYLESGNTAGWVGTFSDHTFQIRTNNTSAITIDTSQNSAFNGNIILDNNLAQIQMTDKGDTARQVLQWDNTGVNGDIQIGNTQADNVQAYGDWSFNSGITGLPSIAFSSGGLISMASDSSLLTIAGGNLGGGASGRIWLYGKDHGGNGALVFVTGDIAETSDVTRLTISGGADTAVASWTDITHTGISASGEITMSDVDLKPLVNNTANVGTSTLRFSTIYGVTIRGLDIATGKILEIEIKPKPDEVFEQGNVVKIFDSHYFTKTTSIGDSVLGVVHINTERVEIGTDIIQEEHTYFNQYTKTVTEYHNVTDVYGNVYLVKDTYEVPLYGDITTSQDVTLANDEIVTIDIPDVEPLGEWITEYVDKEVPVYGPKGDAVLVFAGKGKVKIGEPVYKDDYLIAGPDGEAYRLSTYIDQLKTQYAGVDASVNNVLTIIEASQGKIIGRAMEDSNGPTVSAMLRY